MQCSYTIEKRKEIYSDADNSERIENHCVWVLRQVAEEGHGEQETWEWNKIWSIWVKVQQRPELLQMIV